jgi:iron complex outermembrane recepter protein
VTGQSNNVWLPSAGVTYALNDHATPYVSYGRGYRIAYFGPGGIISGYYNNQKTFDAQGITADMLAGNQKLETADNIDLGVRLKFGSWQITPIVFYSKYQNKSVTMLDPASGIVYRQTVGDAQAHGAELEVNGKLFEGLSLFASGTYDNSTFKSNVPSTSGKASINGNQFPDTPQYMGKLGFTYVPEWLPALAISPIGRYLGPRYGDATHLERIPGYAVADLNATYKLGNFLPSGVKDVTLCLDFVNIFNKKYISYISAADESRQTAAQYFPGAPFTVSASITAKF